MMNVSKKFLLTALIPAVAFTSFSLSAADAAPAKTGKKITMPVQAPKAPAKEVTLESALAFLPDTIAQIGARKITKAEFIKAISSQIPPQALSQIPPAEFKKWIVEKGIPEYVDFEVLMELINKAGYKPSEKDVRAGLDAELKKIPAAQIAELEKRIKAQTGKTLEQYKAEQAKNPVMQKNFMFQKWMKEKIEPKCKASAKELQDFYNANKQRYTMPEMATASHILIQVGKTADNAKADKAAMEKADKDAKAKAEAILAQLKKGADFATLAKENSACPSKANGGSLGEFPRGSMVPEFEKATFAMKPGELSGVVKTPFGYHIIKLTAKKPAGVLSFDQAKKDIETMIENQKFTKELKATIDQAKKDFKVIISKI